MARTAALLDCLHWYDGKFSTLGDTVFCNDGCKGAERQVVFVNRRINGEWQARCQTCSYVRKTGLSHRLAELYSHNHEHPVVIEWAENVKPI